MKPTISILVTNLADHKMARRLLLYQIEKEVYKRLYSNRPEEIETIRKKNMNGSKP
jgi:hypothetical protein